MATTDGNRIGHTWRRVRTRPELLIMVLLGISAMIAFAVWKLWSEISEGETDAFDRLTLIWIRGHLGGIGWLRAMMLDLTAFGDTATLTVVVIAASGYLLALRRVRLAAFYAVQAALGTSIPALIKPWFGRLRPDVVPHWGVFSSASFPSGHAANSAVVYLSLAIIAARLLTLRSARIYVALLAVVLVISIGLSRLYLGVHWPTDVLAGWTIGASWSLLMGAALAYGRRWSALRPR